jgi:hypothetical protein
LPGAADLLKNDTEKQANGLALTGRKLPVKQSCQCRILKLDHCCTPNQFSGASSADFAWIPVMITGRFGLFTDIGLITKQEFHHGVCSR